MGFVTVDLGALVERVMVLGGKLLSEIKPMAEYGGRVVFSTHLEGRLSENVEMVAA